MLNDSCSLMTDCSDAVNNSYCESDVCQCLQGYQASADFHQCTLRHVYDTCSTAGDCSAAVEWSNCSNGVCQCLAGYQVSVDNTTCSKRLIGSGQCETTVDCTASVVNSNCTDGLCMCNSGYKVTGANDTCTKRKLMRLKDFYDEIKHKNFNIIKSSYHILYCFILNIFSFSLANFTCMQKSVCLVSGSK